MANPVIVGWRLDLARNRLWWRGGRYLTAKTELFALIAKVQSANQLIEVCLYVDTPTWTKYYRRWLDEEGVSSSALPARFEIKVIAAPQEKRNMQRPVGVFETPYFVGWLEAVDEAIDQSIYSRPELYPERPPDYLSSHQQTAADSIVAIWQ